MTKESFATFLSMAILLSTFLCTSTPQFATANPDTLNVPEEYPTIQAAIDAASTPDDIILVAANTYNENLFISKTLTIEGEDRDATIINGGNGDYTLHIYNTANVKVTSFTIQNAAKAVVFVERSNSSVIDNAIISNGTESGVYLEKSNNCVVSNNKVLFNGLGVHLDWDSRNNTISGNTVRNNTEAGVYLDGASDNIVSGNAVVWNGYESLIFGVGIHLDYGARRNRLSQNNVTQNSLDGLYLVFSNDNIIESNTISNNVRAGIALSSSNSSVIYENKVFENSKGVLMSGSLTGHIFYWNNFIENSAQLDLREATGIVWDNGAEGNYWSDYAGEDLDGDGVGETLTPHLGVDSRPLMEPWSLFRVFDAFVWNTMVYRIATYSNCTVASFEYVHTLKQVGFNVTGPVGAFGFCNVTIPRGLTREPWLVLIDQADVTADALIVSNVTHSSLCFNYTLSTHRVNIVGAGGLDVEPPIAEAGPDRTIDEDVVCTFDGSGSTDDIGIANYTWTFIDLTHKTLAGIEPTYTFRTPGTYSVMLNVTDVAANWATDNVTITVLDVTPPVAEAGSDQTVTVGTEVTFDAGSSSDNVGIVFFEWDFGDQTPSQAGSTATHTYTNLGTYVVTLTVKDVAENSATDSLTVTVVEASSQWWIWIALAIVMIAIILAATYFIARRKIRTKRATID